MEIPSTTVEEPLKKFQQEQGGMDGQPAVVMWNLWAGETCVTTVGRPLKKLQLKISRMVQLLVGEVPLTTLERPQKTFQLRITRTVEKSVGVLGQRVGYVLTMAAPT